MTLETEFIGKLCTILDTSSQSETPTFDPDNKYRISGNFMSQVYGTDVLKFVFIHPDTGKIHIVNSKFCKIPA